MSPLESVPVWAALPVALLLVLAGCLAVTGALGLLRLSNFYQRIHGPALLNSLGAGCVLIASMLYFSALQSRPVIHELLITVFMLLTAPVTAILLMRAAIFRDRRAGRNDVPPATHRQGDPLGRTGDREE
jgi:multicomponent K+:H+ antiporter subunit G